MYDVLSDICAGFYDVVAELLTGFGRKTAVKSKNKEGRTALHLAAKGGHVHIVGKLLESGARTDSKDKVQKGGKGGGHPAQARHSLRQQGHKASY